jgi:integrase
MKASKKAGSRLPPGAGELPRSGDGCANGDRSAPLDVLECATMTSSETQRPQRLPRMGRHSTGQARVALNGKMHYLGAFGSPEAHARYAELIRQWLAGGRRPLQQPHAAQVMLTVRDLFARFREWVALTGRYMKNGLPTSQQHLNEIVMREFDAFAGTTRTTNLGESVLVRWRDRLEEKAKLTRRGVNRKVSLLLSILKWGRSRGLLTREAWADCAAIEPLRRGECGTRREHVRQRRAVTRDEVERVAAASSCRHIAAMLRLQAILGCRPGEVCAIRWMDIDRKPVIVDGVTLWTYRVPQAAAKTAHHARAITYPVPPAAQAILEQFPAPPAALIFSPQRSMAERGRARKTAPAFSASWNAYTYRAAVVIACAKADVPYFCPHEIRHGAITRAAEQAGVLAAQRLANHSSATTTARYLHADDNAAFRVLAAQEKRGG